ncbi:MAG: SH3 domain-containing protein, partial [Phycisphaerales bacterium]|nr:SH3 domain-containing protein [Phycisphaerales bacterium]
DAGKNPADCVIRAGKTEAGIAKKCWALRELCCPYMPQTIDVGTLEDAAKANERRRIQAQLKHLFTKNAGASNPYVDPGLPDGDFGTAPDKATIATAGVTLRQSPGTGAGTAFTPNKVTTANQKVTPLDASGTWRKIQLDDGTIAWIPQDKIAGTFPSSTRRAIKAVHDRVSTTAGTALKQAPACFKLDAATLAHLDANAPIHKPKAP